MRLHRLLMLVLLVAASRCQMAYPQSTVFNGNFETLIAGKNAPEGWVAEATPAMVQEITSEVDPERGRVLKHTCTKFVPGTNESHAMIAQYGHVGAKSGQWYRLSFWAKAAGLQDGVVQVGLRHTKEWFSVGLSDGFVPGDAWQQYEFVFRATRDLQPADSRLQIWFATTGTLWLSNVAMEETTEPKYSVFNGNFETLIAGKNVPEGWVTAGSPDIIQEITSEVDPVRGRVLKHTCTKFVPGTADSHAMVAQYGHVGAKSGQWYRLSLWARAADLVDGVVAVRLRNVKTWSSVGLAGEFLPGDAWQQYEFVFRATENLRPADSRLQLWFGSTGTLWLSNVAIEETTEQKQQNLPVLPLAGVPNAIPNSSFECGDSGWASTSADLPWGMKLFHLIGAIDDSQAFHGKRSLKVTLSVAQPTTLYLDYPVPARGELHFPLTGPVGWVQVQRGQPYTFSAYVKGTREYTPASLYVVEANGDRDYKQIIVLKEWQRIERTFTPKTDQVWAYIGCQTPPDSKEDVSFWIDAVQIEPGSKATEYRPRAEVETEVDTQVPGNIFTDPAKGLSLRLSSYNASGAIKTLDGKLTVTDFMGRTVGEFKPSLTVAPGQSGETRLDGLLPGKQGFFRVKWEPQGGLVREIRCAVIIPYTEDDTAFGFNHPFSDPLPSKLSHLAGMRYWRTWSVDWETVQPKPGPMDFSRTDMDINRIEAMGGKPVVLFPTATSIWAADADAKRVADLQDQRQKREIGDAQLRRAMTGFRPKKLEDWTAFVRAAVNQYKGKTRCFEILNEPLYTIYSLPAEYGYKVADYLDVLRTAYQAAKAADPSCSVIGGISCWPDSDYETQFIEQGGLQWCDVSNYHWYPTRQRAEAVERIFAKRWDQMGKHGQQKHIWVTEFAIYGDDDPAFKPFQVGDDTMNATLRADELTCASDIVELATVMFAHGVRKIFYHAGTCAEPHENSAGNIFFHYGGVPRKQFASQAVLSRLLGPDMEFVRKWDQPEGAHAFEFRSRGKTVVVAWTGKAAPVTLTVPAGLQALDMMGNALEGGTVKLSGVPVYLVSK